MRTVQRLAVLMVATIALAAPAATSQAATAGPGPSAVTTAPVVDAVQNTDLANGDQGWPGQQMRLAGSGLAGATVTVDGDPADVTASAGAELTFTLPDHDPGEAEVTVTTDGGTDSASVTYLDPAGRPTLTGLARADDPASAIGQEGEEFAATGTGLGEAGVTVDGVAAEVVESSDERVAFILPAHEDGDDVPVIVETPEGAVRGTVEYAATGGAVPEITGLEPEAGSVDGGQPVTVTGTNLSPAEVSATLDGKAVPIRFVDSSTLTLVPPAHAAGTVRLVVTNGDGAAQTSETLEYTYKRSAYRRLSPSVLRTTGGTATVSGENLSRRSTVTVGGRRAKVLAASPTAIRFTAPAHRTGRVAVVVGGLGGSKTFTLTYRR